MDILELGTELIKQKFGVDLDGATIQTALSKLMSGSDGTIDIPQLVSQFMSSGGLDILVQSWLGDGDNAPISASQITEFFGSSKISDFASNLGVGEGTATEGLAEVLPQLIDKVSSGGNLLDSAGDLGSMFDMAKKLF